MRKILSFVIALMASIALHAMTTVTFDFSNATVYGYENPASGQFAQVSSGAVLTKDDVNIAIAFESGNGFRFFAHSTTGVVNLRAYVGSSFVITAPEGNKIYSISIAGSNLNTTYLSGDITGSDWSSEVGVESLTTNVIKSTVQFNTMAVTFGVDGDVDAPSYDTLTVEQAIAIADTLPAGQNSIKYYVEGYAARVSDYNIAYNNQTFFLVDSLTAENDSALQAYQAVPKKDGQPYMVLAGDKLRLFGQLKKYVKDSVAQLEVVNATVEFLEEAEGDHAVPEPQIDTVTVAQALALGKALQHNQQTTNQYVIEGFVTALTDNRGVANADGGWEKYKNQCMWVHDTYDTTAITKDTAFFVYQGVAPEQVIKGAKIRFTCFIKNYNGMIETAAARGAITILQQGEDSVVVPVQEKADTISVARALEIGAALAEGAISDSTYVIAGYVSSIIQKYDTTKQTQSFWMVDSIGGCASTNAAGAFEVYQGKPDTAVGIDAKVFVTTKIKKYKPKTGNAVIETDGTPIVNVVEAGHEETIEAITVAQALAIGNPLKDTEVACGSYEITGYVSNIVDFYTASAGYETFWITDDSTSTASSSANGAFEIYRGKPNTNAEIGLHAKIKIVCKIKKYGSTIENDGSNIVFEVLKQGEEIVIDTISVTVEEARELTAQLPSGEKSIDVYAVRGFVVKISSPYDSQYGNISFYMDDEYPSSNQDFQIYRAKVSAADAANIKEGAYVIATGRLDNNSHGKQMAQGASVVLTAAPDTLEITPSEAVELGMALADNKQSTEVYAVVGYAVRAAEYDSTDVEYQDFWLANELDGEGVFRAYQASVPGLTGVANGNHVRLVGRLFKYVEGEDVNVQMKYGVAEIITDDEAIENIILTEKVQKVIVDGVLYIVRDGKLFNAQGMQVR